MSRNPHSPAMQQEKVFSKGGIYQFVVEKVGCTPSLQISNPPDWRPDLLKEHAALLRREGCSEADVAAGIAHMRQWDCPVSTDEMKRILEAAGFLVQVHDYQNTHHPLKNYFAMMSGEK